METLYNKTQPFVDSVLDTFNRRTEPVSILEQSQLYVAEMWLTGELFYMVEQGAVVWNLDRMETARQEAGVSQEHCTMVLADYLLKHDDWLIGETSRKDKMYLCRREVSVLGGGEVPPIVLSK